MFEISHNLENYIATRYPKVTSTVSDILKKGSQEASGIAIVEARSTREIEKTIAGIQHVTKEGALLTAYIEYEIRILEEILQKKGEQWIVNN